MHRFMQRLQACERSGWEPFVRRQVKDTQIHHEAACCLRGGGLCDCEGSIRVILRDGRVFELDAAGAPTLAAKH